MPGFITTNTPLAPLTTIKLGGTARYFADCQAVDQLREALTFARQKELSVYVLAGGSNTIFPDDGFNGLVIHVALTGRNFNGETVTVAAGEVWDDLVQEAINQDLAGIETMSGVPGSVGATPMQNVGAYGQEVSQTITKVEALDRSTLEKVTFNNPECEFGYRTSRFKTRDYDKYIITRVTYQLRHNGAPTLAYPQLAEALAGGQALKGLAPGREQLQAVRDAVLNIRRRKSMVIDPADPNTRSCGSFFVNPVLSSQEIKELANRDKDRAMLPVLRRTLELKEG